MLAGCKKEYLETSPTGQVPSEQVFNNTEGAYVALNGTYRSMWTSLGGSHGHFGQKSHDLAMDLMGNDMVVHTRGYGWFIAEYQLTAQTTTTDGSRSGLAWQYYYRTINNANLIIKNVDNASGSQADKDNLKGQALALRAYNYFYLVNLWQHTYKGNENKPAVPLYTAPTTEGKSRATVQEVYTQILADLKEAETLLEGKPRRHISHINQATVKGIWARVALQMEDWETAAAKAAEARQGVTLMTNAQFTSGFGVKNSEWIWGLEIPNDQSTIFASLNSHFDASTLSYASLGLQKKITKQLYDQIPDGDIRKTLFKAPGTGTSTFPDYNQTKFKLPTSGSWAADYILMRSAEMYLIEAEAKARLGQEGPARAALEELGKARNSTYTAPQTGANLINEILLQRRIELWGEGFSLLDIKRLKLPLNRPSGAGNHQAALAITFDMPAEDPKWLWKIPQSEIDANDAIEPGDQNP